MNGLNEKSANTELYASIQRVPMGERERQATLIAVRNAEAIVDGCLWAVNGVKAVIARVLEKPAGLKHSH